MEKKIEDCTLLELKAAAYDVLAQIEASQNQLRFINSEIIKKTKQSEQVKE